MVQLSTIQALAQGLYTAIATLDDMRAEGNVGIGTYEHLDGEMIHLDSCVYRFDEDGFLHQETDRRTPFFVVTELASQPSLEIPAGFDYDQLKDFLLARARPNLPHVVRFEGRFRSIRTRSLPAQTLPYPSLLKVARRQPVFDYRDVEGCLIGFFFPNYLATTAYPGFHLHFIDEARTRGGHVLDFVIHEGMALIDPRPEFRLVLPGNDPTFLTLDLDRPMLRELKQAEG